MSRNPKNPLRPLLEAERQQLTRLSRGLVIAASSVARAKALLAIADGYSYTDAAWAVAGALSPRIDSGGSAKWLTLFHPATGTVRVQGVTHSPNTVLHPWFEQELTAIIAALPPLNNVPDAMAHPAAWVHWQAGLSVRFTRLETLPPLRLLLILDHLAGHQSAVFVCWLMTHGVMPLYTPLFSG